MKDWNYYRRICISDNFDYTNRVLKNADKMTPIESIAYITLVSVRSFFGIFNMKIDRQFNIGDYRVDFLVTAYGLGSEYKIVIECDGHDFHEKTKEQSSKDKKRDRFLQSNGYVVFRYSGADIVNDPSIIADDIIKLVYPEKVTKDGS